MHERGVACKSYQSDVICHRLKGCQMPTYGDLVAIFDVNLALTVSA
jgi:hypothetical protein